MVDIFNEWGVAFLTALGALLLAVFMPFFLGYAVARFIIKSSIVLLVLWFADQTITFLVDMFNQYLPAGNEYTAFACQLGIFAGLDLFFKIVFTVYVARWIIRASIEA